MKGIDDKTTEEILHFGKSLGEIDALISIPFDFLEQHSPFSEEVKKTYVKGSSIPQIKKYLAGVIKTINENYSGIPTAETTKEYILKKLSEIDILVKPYLN